MAVITGPAGDGGLAPVAAAWSRGDIEHVYRHLRARSAGAHAPPLLYSGHDAIEE
jgi:hypothetical protein